MPSEKKQDFTYVFTKDPDLLNQYLEIRQNLYPTDKKFIGFRKFSYLEHEDYSDPKAKMLIVLKGKKCIGGARLTVHTPGSDIKLPLEYDITPENSEKTTSLQEFFPELHLENKTYGEFNRIVMLPQYRNGEFTKE